MQIVEYGLVLPANVSRTLLLDGTVRGTTAGFTQKLTVICQWASIEEIDAACKTYFPTFSNMGDVTGQFVMDGEPSIESVVTPDHYLKNATLTGSAWLTSDVGEEPGILATRGSLG